MRQFGSFGAFARHLVVTAEASEAVSHHVTEQAARIVQTDAQDRIGEYQGRAGPFAAWRPLAPSTVEDRISQGYLPNEPLLREGTLRDSIVSEARGNQAVVGSGSEIALYQEVGTEHIPARSFLGAAGFASKRKIGVMAANTVIAWIAGRGWRRPAENIPSPDSPRMGQHLK